MKKNLKWFVLAAIVILFIAMTVIPPVLTQTSTAKVKEQIETTTATIDKIQSLYDKDKLWFKPEYFNFNLNALKGEFSEAKGLSLESSGMFSKRISNNYKVISLLKQNKQKLDAALKNLESNESIRKEAIDLQSKLKQKKDGLAIHKAEERYSKESADFLEKYKKQMTGNISQSNNFILEGSKQLNRSVENLPELSDKNQKGDPKQAMVYLKSAEASFEKADVLAIQVIKDLDYQIEARSQASAKSNIAANELQKVKNSLLTTEKKYLFTKEKSLSLAYSCLDKAVVCSDNSKKKLLEKIENGKTDYVVAYESAIESISWSSRSLEENEKQILSYQTALADKKVIETLLSDSETNLVDYKRAHDTLRQNHNSSCWIEVENNYSNVKNTLVEAKRIKILADGQMTLSKQEFVLASENYKKVLSILDESRRMGLELVTLTNTLEDYKNRWPSLYDSAFRSIEDERDLVDRYGSYDSSAKSDFDEAIRLLERSKSEAIGGYYQRAVEDALSADREADGTGRRCQNSYDDSQRSNDNLFNSNNNNFNNGDLDGGFDYGGGNDGGFDFGGGNDGGGFDYGGGGDGGGLDYGGGGDGGGLDYGGGGDGGGW